ncbi:hypothetical protein WA171_006565 [Blastocystis sp. BT1]
MDLDPFTTGRLPNTIGTYIEWTVENLEGSKWNSFNILGSYTVSSWGFDIYGYSNPDDEQAETTTILNAIDQTVTSRTKPQIPVPVALAGFRRYRWQVTNTASWTTILSSVHMAYCKPTGSVCPSIDNYPSVNEGQVSPSSCPEGYSGYSYCECSNGVLGEVKMDHCVFIPSSEFIASSDWDSIPLNVQSLIFDSNSFPDMIDVDLSNFTSLQSLQFREGSFASASSLTIIGYHIFLYSFIGLTQLNTILFHNHSFPITHSIILQDLSVHSIQVGEDCFNGIGSFEGRRLASTSIAKLTLKNNGMLQEMKIPAGSFTQIKNIEMSNLQNLKMIEIEGEKGEKGAPFQSTSSFVTNGTPNLEVMKLGNKVCQSGSVFSIDSKMIKEVEIGKKCFQGTDKESQYGAKAQQFVMIDQPKLISTKIDKNSFVYFDTYNLMNNPKQRIANVAYSKSISSFGRRLEDDDLPSFSGVKEIVMKNLTSLEETVFGKGSFPNVTVINLSELPVVKNITLEEGSFGKTEELILVNIGSGSADVIEIGNNTLSSVVRLTTSGTEMDMQLAEQLKNKIEEVTEDMIDIEIATLPPTLPPTTIPSPTTLLPTTLPSTQSPATPSPPVSYECTHQGYSIYLSHYSLKCSSDCDQYMENHYPFYYTSCITLNSIRYKYPFASTLNALADFNTTHLDLLADISVKYHRTGSYADPIIPLQPSFFNPHIHSRHLCSTHPQLQSYMISHQCSTSWISAIQEAAEAAMLRHNQTVHFSFDFIKECAPIDDDGCNGMHPKDIQHFLSDVGLITEQEYQSVSSHANLCHIRFNHMYRFNMIGMEGRNKGGLMNLVSEGYPTLSLIALSINNLRFVPPQSNQHFIGVLNEPSVMGVVKGYDSQSQHPYWLVDVSIIPCEPIQLRLPMTSSETNANYGGIAGYAFGIEPLH